MSAERSDGLADPNSINALMKVANVGLLSASIANHVSTLLCCTKVSLVLLDAELIHCTAKDDAPQTVGTLLHLVTLKVTQDAARRQPKAVQDLRRSRSPFPTCGGAEMIRRWAKSTILENTVRSKLRCECSTPSGPRFD